MKRLVFFLPILLFFQPCFSQNNIDYYTIPGLVVGSGNGNVYEVDTKSGVYFDRREDDTTGHSRRKKTQSRRVEWHCLLQWIETKRC